MIYEHKRNYKLYDRMKKSDRDKQIMNFIRI